MTHRTKKLCLYFFALLVLLQPACFSFHTTNRYFPFLERPEDFLPRKHFLFQASPFHTTSSSSFNQYWHKGKIAELNGSYDLNDVITSLEFTQGNSFQNPIVNVTGDTGYVGMKMPFSVNSKIKSVGYTARWEGFLPWCNMSFGCWVPIAWVSTVGHYSLNQKAFLDQLPWRTAQSLDNNQTTYLLEKIRRTTHDELGFERNYSSQLLVGDLDLYGRWNHHIDHQLLMKSINISVQSGLLVPLNRDSHANRQIPTWVPLMSNGHLGLYVDVVPQFELKQDVKVGSIFSALYQVGLKKTSRIPVYKESMNFSALEGRVKVNPGTTIKIAPFVTLENLTDGLHFQARYNYTRHTIDKVFDYRCDKKIPSYLTITPNDFSAITSTSVRPKADDIAANIRAKEALSKWRSHYISFEAVYDLSKNKKYTPDTNKYWSSRKIYVLYDMPFNGKSIALTHQLTFGVDLTF